jgi:CheY-like chemotaxis protein
VDDKQQNREVLSQMLAEVGCHVELAEGGEQALARVATRVPDVVFLDIRMPGMDGNETARRIRQRWGTERPKLVAVSASALLHEQDSFLAAGFAAFLGKPVQFAGICECLERLLHVEFEPSTMSAEAKSVAGEVDFSRLHVPPAILQRLIAAAENHSRTELRVTLTELAEANPDGARLAEVLQPLVHEFDLPELLEIVRQVRSS